MLGVPGRSVDRFLQIHPGMDVAQTAKVLDKRDGAVRIAAMRGLKRLAAILAEQEAAGESGQDAGTSGGTEGTGDAEPGRTAGRSPRTVKGAEYG